MDPRTRGASLLKLDPKTLMSHPDQPRSDYGTKAEWESFKADIRENGVREPIKVMRNKDNEWIIVNGHRRVRAVMELIAEGCEFETINALTEGRGISQAEILFGMMSSNNGKPLTPYEEAVAWKKLEAWGVQQAEIARRRGIDAAVVSTRLKIMKGASPKVLAALEAGKILFSTANDILRAAGDENEQNTLLGEELKQATGKGARRTSGASEALREAKEKKSPTKPQKKLSTVLSSTDIIGQIRIATDQVVMIQEQNETFTLDIIKGIAIGLKIAAGTHPMLLPTGQLEANPETFVPHSQIEGQLHLPNVPAKDGKKADKPIIDKMAPARLKKIIQAGGSIALGDPVVKEGQLLPMAVKKLLEQGTCFTVSINADGNVVWTPSGKVEGEGTITTSATE
jgi:ParB/RepB/Spo0J family partition protein